MTEFSGTASTDPSELHEDKFGHTDVAGPSKTVAAGSKALIC